MNVLSKVKELCKEKGIKLYQLEEYLGISKGGSSKWNKYIPNSATLQNLADYFGVSIDYLLGRAEYKNRQEELIADWDSNEQNDLSDKVKMFDLISKYFGEDAAELLDNYSKLNETGKRKVSNDISDMLQLKKYIM